MPSINHNRISLVQEIRAKAEIVKRLILRLRHLIETGNFREYPNEILDNLSIHTYDLSKLMSEYTIRNDEYAVYEKGRDKYETPIEFVENELKDNPNYLYTPVEWEWSIYQELGYTRRDFDDLIQWKNHLSANKLDLEGAYQGFIDYIVDDIFEKRDNLALIKTMRGTSGMIGFSADVLMFQQFGLVPALVSSCITGISSMAIESDKIRNTLFGRNKK